MIRLMYPYSKVKDGEIESLSDNKKSFLNRQEIKEFMHIIITMIWLQGVRIDIISSVLYLRKISPRSRGYGKIFG
jgi:hypothetical protein